MVSMRFQEVPKVSQDGPKMFQDGSYGPRHDPKRGQDGPKGTQGGPQMVIRWPQKGTNRIPKRNIVRFKKPCFFVSFLL